MGTRGTQVSTGAGTPGAGGAPSPICGTRGPGVQGGLRFFLSSLLGAPKMAPNWSIFVCPYSKLGASKSTFSLK